MASSNIQVKIPEENLDKYVLCATLKHGFAYNSLLFWGKNNSGYYPNINNCQLYTLEEVQKHTNSQNVAIKLVDLVDKLSVQAEDPDWVNDYYANREVVKNEI